LFYCTLVLSPPSPPSPPHPTSNRPPTRTHHPDTTCLHCTQWGRPGHITQVYV
jgi:hypothetical protein